MAVVIEEFDIGDMSWSTLGRIEDGEIVADGDGFLSELLSDDELGDEDELLNRFNGPRLVAYRDRGTLGKNWIPYQGPMGGEGWQNANDPDDIRYVDDPPGEIEEGYEEQAEGWGESDQERFVNAVEEEYGVFASSLANAFTEETVLKDPYDSGYVKLAAKVVFGENYPDESVAEYYEEFRELTNLDTIQTPREATMDVIAAIDELEPTKSQKNQALDALRDRYNIMQSADGLPQVPLEDKGPRDWKEHVPGRGEDYDWGTVNTQDAVLYQTEDGLMNGRIWKYEGEDDQDVLYTLENGETLYHEEIEAFYPNEKEALRVGSNARVSEGNFLTFEIDGTPYQGEVSTIAARDGQRVEALISTPGAMVRLSSTTEEGRDPQLESVQGDDIEIIERQRTLPDDFEGMAEGVNREADAVARDITDNLGDEWHRSMSLERDVQNELEKYFSSTAVSQFYEAVNDWKQDASSGLSGLHASSFQEALDIHSPARGWDEPSKENVQVAKVMYEVSQEYLKKTHGSSVRLHRGMSNTGFRRLMDTWLENPNADEYDLSQMALNNYTPQVGIAEGFAHDTAVVTSRVSTDNIAFAMDALAARSMDNEGEVHVMGDGMTVDHSDIAFGEHRIELDEFPDGWSLEEHEDMVEQLKHHYAGRMPLPKESHEEIFQKWAESVKENHPELVEGPNPNPEIQELVKTIETDAFLQYEVRQGPQTQLDEFEDKQDSNPVIDLTDDASARWSAYDPAEIPDTVKETKWNQYRNWQQSLQEKSSSPIGKAWIPYEGPRGGEGWQSANDPNKVVYQQEPPGEVADEYDADHWEEYPSDGNWPESPHGTPWEQPQGFGRDAGMQLTDAVAFINYDDEVVAGEIAEFNDDEKTYKLENGYVISHSQVVGWSQPPEGERVETSVGMVTEGDWITYDTSYSEDHVAQISDIEINDDKDIISVVGEHGYYEIEVSGRPNNRNEFNAKVQRIHTEEPDLFENVEQNGMAMETDDIVGEMSERIDLKDTMHQSDQLKQEQRENIRNTLETYFPEQYVNAYYGSIESWKVNNAAGSAEEHETAFKEALGIESPSHAEALHDKEPSTAAKAHQKIAKVMADLSDEYWEANFGGRAEVHRGISNTAFENLFPQWLETPNATKYNVKQLALNNFSRSRHTANGFGERTAVVTLDADKDDVVLCTDAISNIGTVQDEAEIQIHGDDQSVDARGIDLFGKDGPTLGEHPSEWEKGEHVEFGQFLTGYYMRKTDDVEEGEAPIPEKHYKTLLEWTRALTETYPDLARRQPTLNSLTREIEQDADTYFGLGPLGKQYTGTFTEETTDSTEYPTIDLTDEASATWLSDASQKPEREDISPQLFEQLVEANRKRRESINTDTDESDTGPMRLKGRVEVGALNKPDWNPVKDSTLQKASDNFLKVDDLLLDAWEKQVCADSIEKAPEMWQRGDNVPQFVRTFVAQAATKRDALWDEYNDVPHMAALKVHEIIKDNVTSDGWSIKTIADDLTDEFEGISKRQAETIARTEVAAVLNDARAMAYKSSDYDLQFYWSGPQDEHTTDICTEVKQEIENRGGYVSMDTLKKILREKARKHRDDGGTPERVSSYLPHFNCRHTLVRSEFRWT